MEYDGVVALAAALGDVAIAASMLWSHGHKARARRFALMAVCLGGWSFGMFALASLPDPIAAEHWSRVARVAMCFAPAVAFRVTLDLAELHARVWHRVAGVGYVLAATLAVANLCGLLVAGVTPHGSGWLPVPRLPYAGVTILITGSLAVSTALMWRTWRRPTSPAQRVRAGCWLLASAIMLAGAATNLLCAYGVPFYPLGSVGNVACVGILAWAMVRHRFMDVDWVVRKTASFALAAGVVLVPTGIVVAWLAARQRADDPAAIAVVAMTAAVIAALAIPTLQRGLETRIHRVLFPRRWKARHRLATLRTTLVQELDQARLVARLGSELTEILDAAQVEILLCDDAACRLAAVWPPDACFELDDPDGSIAQLRVATLVDELPRAAAEPLRARAWAALVPLHAGNRISGLVALGETRRLWLRTSETLALLDGVAASAGIALGNCRAAREQRRAEAVLMRANRLSSLGQLAAGIAHEIRNPLVAVKTFLDLLPQRLDDRDFVTGFRELSLGELKRVTDLIADLLALGKGSAPERGTVDLVAAVDGVVRLVASTARKRNVELVAAFPPGLPAVWADAAQLKQIALNLVMNALEASPAGTVVEVDATASDAGVVLRVADHGAGIAREHLDAIFEPFFTTKESGTGLGLALVHQMVVEHGGDIGVDSAVGRGTTVRVTLPAAAALQRTGT